MYVPVVTSTVLDERRGRRRLARGAAAWSLIVMGLIALGLALWTLINAGIGYDALFESQASVVNRGMNPALSLDEAYELAPVTSEFYGMLLYQISEAIHQVITGSSVWMSPDDPSTYVWLNLITFLYATASVVALAFAIGRALHSTLAGSFVFAGVTATPLWLGMSTLNYKDVPVAAGLTLMTAGLIGLLGNQGTRGRWLSYGMTSLGAIMALGGRAGALPLITALPLIVLVVTLILDRRHHRFERSIRMAVAATVSPALAILAMWLTNPFARIDLRRWLWDSIVIAQQYEWEGAVRTAGQELISTELPWWYSPVWLVANLPILTTALVLSGLIAYLLSAVRRNWGIGRQGAVMVFPLIAQGVILPCAVLLTSPVLYDGIRHLLFVIPPLVALSVVALVSIAKEASAKSIASLLAVVVVGASLFAVVRWFPYHYAFINPIAGWDKSTRNWELDYWGVSAREAVERLAADGLTPIAILPVSEPARPYGALSTKEVAQLTSPWEKTGIYVFRRWHWEIDQIKCAVTFTVERDGLLLGEGGYCPR